MTANIAIRPYRPEDLEMCRELWRELTQRHRDIYDDQSIGGDDPGPAFDAHLQRVDLAGVWLAEHAGAVVGLVGLLMEDDQGEVEPIVVISELRSRGIGRQLLAHAVGEARERGARLVSIRPVARNAEAMALFHRAGFRALGHIDMTMDLSGREWKTGLSLHGLEFQY